MNVNFRRIGLAALIGCLVAASAPAAAAAADADAVTVMGAAGLKTAARPAAVSRVCLVDTGVNPVPGAVRRVAVDGGAPDDVTSPGREHGTYGVRLARSLWPHAEVVSVRVMRADGSISYSNVAAGIRLCLTEPGVAAVSVPLAGEAPADSTPGGRAMRDAVAAANAASIPVFAGSGNHGGQVGYPARLPGVVAVGGFMHADVCQSSIVPAFGPEVQLTAPVCELDAGGVFVEGTSYATTAVATAFAALRSYSNADTATVLSALTSTVSRRRGVPVINVKAAFDRVGASAALGTPRPAGDAAWSAPVSRRVPAPRVSVCRARSGLRVVRRSRLPRGAQMVAVAGRARFAGLRSRKVVLPAAVRKVRVFTLAGGVRSKSTTAVARVCRR